jgi:hypothetical protein
VFIVLGERSVSDISLSKRIPFFYQGAAKIQKIDGLKAIFCFFFWFIKKIIANLQDGNDNLNQ